ncbi:MAG: SseB family protein [Alphaproteobacteria bacterium]
MTKDTKSNGAGNGPGNGERDGPTALDLALIKSEEGEAQALAFYDAFFNARLYIPTTEPEGEAEEGSVTLLVADIDGEGVVPVFDSQAQLAGWAEREMPFTVLAGHALVEHLDPELQIALNAGHKQFKLFVGEELGWLRARLDRSVHALEGDQIGEQPSIVKAEAPPQLTAALAPALARNTFIGAAFLVAVENDKKTDPVRWLLVLDVGDAGEAVFAEIARDIGVAAQAALDARTVMDVIAFDPSGGPGLELLRLGIEPFYAR